MRCTTSLKNQSAYHCVMHYSALNSNSNLELTTTIVLIPKAMWNHFHAEHINERRDANHIICETISNSTPAKINTSTAALIYNFLVIFHIYRQGKTVCTKPGHGFIEPPWGSLVRIS